MNVLYWLAETRVMPNYRLTALDGRGCVGRVGLDGQPIDRTSNASW